MPHSALRSSQELSNPRAFGRSLIVGLGVVALYWFFDSWLHAVLEPGAGLQMHLLQPSIVEVVPRLFVSMALVVVIGLLAILRNEERKLRFTQISVDFAGDGVFWSGETGRILYVNEVGGRALGYTREELEQMRIAELDPNFPPERWPLHWKELRTRKTLTFETVHRAKSGELVPVEVTARYVEYGGRELNCASVRYISERKKAEEKLRASEEQTRLLLESTGEGILGVDMEGRCTFVNPASLQLLGYSEASELLGKTLHPIFHHTHRDGSFYAVEDCLGCRAYQEGKSIRVDDEIYFRKDGSGLEVEYRVYPMRRNDQLIGAVYVFSDVSLRKKAERDLKANTEKLKEANRLKDLFTDILRHDLMNPASAIKVSAELLTRIEKDPLKLRAIGRIAKSTESLISQCESAAKYARAAQATDLVFAEENLGSLLKKTIQEFEPQLKAKGMVLDESFVGECRAEVNPMLIDVFSNLISNAIKYSPEGTRIGLAVQDQGNACRISIRDQGEGIPDQDKERVFTRFERVGKEGVKGSGLGLAIAKQLVEMHRGRIWVENNPGGGSVFFVEIPKKSRVT
ncbi:MAG: hypothetical protein A2X94_13330 [Bdellovibrionales bacterium GWB1_55_8]|nr:MAG: hypothetical protein A2X94_13330 [Bdellovibrionales bacterium GWB1_55_8]